MAETKARQELSCAPDETSMFISLLLSFRNLEHRTMAGGIYGYLGLFGLTLAAHSSNTLFVRPRLSSTIEPITSYEYAPDAI